MPSRASCIDRSLPCLTPATRDLTPATPCKMLPWVPLVSFLPNHRRFWSISAGCSTPKDTIMLRPCWASSGFLVTIRSARYSIQSHHAISMRYLWRSLKALNSTTCWHTFGSLATNCWWLWMGPTTFRPKRSTVPTVSPANSPMARPSIIMPQDGHTKQDCERAGGKRWLAAHAAQVAPHGVTFLGDDLYSNQPFCALVLQHRCNFILTCKPDSHPTFYERV